MDFDGANESDVHLLGGKGAGLVGMARAGLPVPPGFILTTEVGRHVRQNGEPPSDLMAEADRHIDALGAKFGRRFGDNKRPLLVSIRSGAPVSMPGMMDTVLNIGLTPLSVAALAAETGDTEFAYSCFARLLESFATTVRGISANDVAEVMVVDELHEARCEALLDLIAEQSGRPFPEAAGQYRETISAVFNSWDSPRARAYRTHKNISDDIGTAVVIQAMVFGNRGQRSGSGVAFTRDPATGVRGACGEFLAHCQGEDVVSGEFDAGPLSLVREVDEQVGIDLDHALQVLERQARDMCDVEFTIEDGQLWILQSRAGQRSSRAATRIAVELVEEGLISRREAHERLAKQDTKYVAITKFVHPPDSENAIATGLPMSPGAASGVVAFDSVRAMALADAGMNVVMIRPSTSPSDLQGMLAAVAVVTGRGGPMSHAAVVARGLDRPAVCGIGAIEVAADRRSAVVAGHKVNEGTEVSVDGDRGLLFLGAHEIATDTNDPYLDQILSWGD